MLARVKLSKAFENYFNINNLRPYILI